MALVHSHVGFHSARDTNQIVKNWFFYFIESIMEEGLNPIYYLDGQAERKILFNNGLCGTLSKAFS